MNQTNDETRQPSSSWCCQRANRKPSSSSSSSLLHLVSKCKHTVIFITLVSLLLVTVCSGHILDSATSTLFGRQSPLTIGLKSAALYSPIYRQHQQPSTSSSNVQSIHRGGGVGVGNRRSRRFKSNTALKATAVAAHQKEEETNGIYSVDEYKQHVTTLCSSTTTTAEPIAATVLPSTSTTPSVSDPQGTATTTNPTTNTRGGSSASAQLGVRSLLFWESMICGAISRSIAQTVMHPANCMKTVLQSSRGEATANSIANLAKPENFKMLTRGAGAQFLLSVPHGAVNFAVLEYVRNRMNWLVHSGKIGYTFASEKWGPGLDFVSSAISTVCCSVVSTPQMMIVDNIMAGTYPNLMKAMKGLAGEKGIIGFYGGWWPGLAGKIPSYGLTWCFFQQLKAAQLRIFNRPPKNIENSIMGCIASTTTVCLMIPMDTIKTRLVTQLNYPDLVPYKGIRDAAVRIFKEEGIGAFYRGLPPRLVSVVPMIGIQFGVYEFMKKVMLQRDAVVTSAAPQAKTVEQRKADKNAKKTFMSTERSFEEVAMEVAADDEQPFPAPHFKDTYKKKTETKTKKKIWSIGKKK